MNQSTRREGKTLQTEPEATNREHIANRDYRQWITIRKKSKPETKPSKNIAATSHPLVGLISITSTQQTEPNITNTLNRQQLNASENSITKPMQTELNMTNTLNRQQLNTSENSVTITKTNNFDSTPPLDLAIKGFQ